MSLNLGETLGAYRLVEQLGQGGMATVYKAYHAALDRYVAVKVLHAAFNADPNFQARFQREARVVARLEHPHIVPVYDYADHHGAPYLVMKFIEGETLKARLQRSPVTALDVMRYVEALGAALDYAHRQGILHRDIKPSNVMLGQDGQIYLADFGLARIADAGESTLSADSMLGTPQYMSPEQARGQKALDAGTDLYSLGVVIYELLVGRAPFNADTPFAVIHDHIYTPLPPPRAINPNVPQGVEAVLQKALAKERADRYASAPELVAALRAAMAGSLNMPTIAPDRVAPADPTAVTPAAPTVAVSLEPAPATVAAASTTTAPGVAAPLSAGPAVPGKTAGNPGWLPWAAAVSLLLVLCLATVFVAQRLRRNNLVLPTGAAATSTTSPAAGTPMPAAEGLSDLFGQAQAALAAGNIDDAVAHLDQAVALDPLDSAVMVRAGDLLLAADQPFGALEKYYVPASELELATPTDQSLVLQSHVSLTYYVLAAHEEAEEFLTTQAANHPDQMVPALALHRYRIFFDGGEGVLEALEPFLDENPNHAAALLIVGDYYLSRGQEALATRFYQRARDVPRPNNRDALDWGDQEARCNLEKLRRLRSAATLEATCASRSLLLTGK